MLAIPYENLDIHLNRTLTLDLDQIYRKIVERRRGGWCYEMNGLFAWALRELGFAVTLLGSSVGAPAQGEAGDLDHLILLVELEEPWLVDVGFGNGILEPLLLVAGEYQQEFSTFRLTLQDDGNWFFHNQLYGGPGYGFSLHPRRYEGFASRCYELQTSPESGFVRTTVCHRFTPQGFMSLRGAVLQQYKATGIAEEEIDTLSRYKQVLTDIFGLDAALADALWEKVWERHGFWKKEQEQQP